VANERLATRALDANIAAPNRSEHRAQEAHSFASRLDQGHVQVAPKEGQRESRRACTCTDVDDARRVWDARREHEGVSEHQIDELLGGPRCREVYARVPLLEALQPDLDRSSRRPGHRRTQARGRALHESPELGCHAR
jgi:hypothetical protein